MNWLYDCDLSWYVNYVLRIPYYVRRDLANDVLTLMSSSKAYLRKKGILTMYKVFVKFPDALRPAFPRLKDRLEDPDPGKCLCMCFIDDHYQMAGCCCDDPYQSCILYYIQECKVLP